MGIIPHMPNKSGDKSGDSLKGTFYLKFILDWFRSWRSQMISFGNDSYLDIIFTQSRSGTLYISVMSNNLWKHFFYELCYTHL